MSQILNAWEESYESDFSDWLIVVRAHVRNHEKPTVMVALYDSQKTEINVMDLVGMSLREARRYIKEREYDYDRLQDLLENPGYGGRW